MGLEDRQLPSTYETWGLIPSIKRRKTTRTTTKINKQLRKSKNHRWYRYMKFYGGMNLKDETNKSNGKMGKETRKRHRGQNAPEGPLLGPL